MHPVNQLTAETVHASPQPPHSHPPHLHPHPELAAIALGLLSVTLTAALAVPLTGAARSCGCMLRLPLLPPSSYCCTAYETRRSSFLLSAFSSPHSRPHAQGWCKVRRTCAVHAAVVAHPPGAGRVRLLGCTAATSCM